MMRAQAIVILSMLMLSAGFAFIVEPPTLPTVDEAFATERSIAVADIPEWRVNDRWVYAGSFDPQGLISQSGVSANIGIITGDSTNTVTEILTMPIENQSTLVYKVVVSADFDKSGVSLDGYNGDLEIDYDAVEYWRASDLGLIQRNLGLVVKFDAFGFINIDVADVIISTSHAPPQESYDFPMRSGETWLSDSTIDVVWSGSSDYINPFPADTSTATTDFYEVTNSGTPINSQGQGISYSGCSDSFEVTSYDSNGLVDGYNWFCPAARSYAWMHTEDNIGLTIDFRLKSYTPTASNGVVSNSNPGQRSTAISVELKNPITPLDATQEAWINITDSSGSPMAGETVELRHEREGVALSGTTSANGSAWFEFDSGDALDPSATTYDWGSHGIIAWQSSAGRIGATTMTLDDNMVALDLVAMTDRVSIVRNRSGDVRPLNEISGFNVLPGDSLVFDLPVMNRGIILSVPTTVEVQQPDGQLVSFNVPALSTYEEYRVGFEWIVPSDSAIGDVMITYEVDPELLNSADADPSNNIGEIPVFVGTLPEVVISAITPIYSMSDLFFSAEQSFDLDGGNVSCVFRVEYELGDGLQWQTIATSDCHTNLSWADDGIFEVIVTVIDEEQDSASSSVNVTVLNRPATVIISSMLTEAPALSMVTMDVFANDTDSEDDWPGLVDIYWPSANCLEGYFTRTCTTTTDVEGMKSFTAIGTDDDGEITQAIWNITFTNAIPRDVNVTLWDANGQSIESDQQGTFQVAEDEEIWLRAEAVDSLDDLSTLEWRWRPDDQDTTWFERTEGDSSAIEVAWPRSGRNIVRLEVVDNDGASSGFIETWVQVENVPPYIDELPDSLPVAESQSVQLTGQYHDTASDNLTLIACWDVDPGINQDGVGSADDDCDVFGDTLAWAWNQDGIHRVIFHVTDNDGARAYQTTNITVVNQPPRPTIKVCEASVGSACELTVSRILDSAADLPHLTYTWDIDATVDSDGDGDATNDADHVGRTVSQTWEFSGSYEVTVRVLDEDVSRPGTASVIVEVSSSQGGLVGDVIGSVIGEEAGLMTKILSLVLIGLIGIVTYRAITGKSDHPGEDIAPWEQSAADLTAEDTPPEVIDLTFPATSNPVSTDLTAASSITATEPASFSGTTSTAISDFAIAEAAPPVPVLGLPPGWTMEQWKYHGKSWLEDNPPQSNISDGDDLDY